jgi:hypothetical protein
MCWISVAVAFFTGGTIGALTMGIVASSKVADSHLERWPPR